jgi:hypothetical protein
MSKDIALGIVIGGAVAASLNRAVGDVNSKIADIKKKADKQRIFKGQIGDAVKLSAELMRAGDAVAGPVQGLKQLDKQLSKLKKAGVDIHNLDGEFKKLDRTIKGLDLKALGQMHLTRGLDDGRAAVGDAMKMTGGLTLAQRVSGDYTAIVRDTAIKSGIMNQPGGNKKEADMAELIRKKSQQHNMNRNVLASSINALVSRGMDLDAALGESDTLAQSIVGQKMDPEDAAKLVYAMKENGVTDSRKGMGSVAIAGDQGAFEAKDMARYMPKLLANIGAYGYKGQDALDWLGASLQAQMRVSGDADEAANNMVNLIGKIISDDTQKKFKKDYGINLKDKMVKWQQEKNEGPVDSFIGIVTTTIEHSDPKRGAAMKKLRERIKSSKDKSADQESAVSDFMQMAGLSEIVNDRQARDAALAQIKYADQIKSDIAKIHNTDGAQKLTQDKALRDETSNRRWEAAGVSFDNAVERFGTAVQPITNWAAGLAVNAGNGAAGVAANHPGLAIGGTMLGAGIVAYKGAKSALNLSRAAIEIGKGSVLSRGAAAAAPEAAAALEGGALAANAARFAKVIPGLTVVAPAVQAVDTALTAKTEKEKFQGYGGAAGSLALGLAGAKAGGLIGTAIAPGIGTAVGAAIGGTIGAFGGTRVGEIVGSHLSDYQHAEPPAPTLPLGATQKPPVTVSSAVNSYLAPKPAVTPLLQQEAGAGSVNIFTPPIVPAAVAAPTRQPPQSKEPEKPAENKKPTVEVHQDIAFSPHLSVTVQGDVKDPRKLAGELMPYLKQMFGDFQLQQRQAALHDEAHV